MKVIYGENLFVGLENTDDNEACQDEECDGRLLWADGTPFIFNSSVMEKGVSSSEEECFVINDSLTVIGWSCDTYSGFLCQFQCSPVIGKLARADLSLLCHERYLSCVVNC